MVDHQERDCAGRAENWIRRSTDRGDPERRFRDIGRAQALAQLEVAHQIGRVADALERFATVAEKIVDDVEADS